MVAPQFTRGHVGEEGHQQRSLLGAGATAALIDPSPNHLRVVDDVVELIEVDHRAGASARPRRLVDPWPPEVNELLER
eukprot:8318765-Heterocapsa_arctica.AAC.1